MGQELVEGSAASATAAIERGAVVVTANERAARTFRRVWEARQRGMRLGRWQTAEVLSWRAWTRLLWYKLLIEGGSTSLLLNPVQEQRIWKSVLADEVAASGLRGAEALATRCAEAYRRLCGYTEEQPMWGARAGLEKTPAAFARWLRSFEQRCNRDRLLPAARLEAELTRALHGNVLRAEGELLVAGFDALTPAQEDLLSAWRGKSGLAAVAAFGPSHSGQLVRAADEAAELRGCARWARDLLEAEPAARVAIVVADLAGERDEIESVLREILAPELENVEADEERAPYEFSLGRTLAAEPMVQAALDLLAWAAGPLPIEQAGALLLSPYFAATAQGATAGDAAEGARAELDVALRGESRLRPEVTIAEVLRSAGRARGGDRLAGLRSVLRTMEASRGRIEGRRIGFGEWTVMVREWLATALWGSAATTSREFQVRQRWEDVLDLLATLDFAGESAEFNEIQQLLRRIARETIFAPEARDKAVQVMGPMEAAGSTFDALWVLRAGELNWPPGLAAEPLLSRALQRELGMPGVDPERDRRAAKRMTERLAGSAAEVVFSYGRVQREGARQRTAAVVRGLGFTEIMIEDLVAPEAVRTVVELERVPEAGTVRALPDAVHRGGVRVLELQAACGFRAFAEMRLGASDLHERGLGLDAGERGNVVHEALESFWAEVGSQQALAAMGEGGRRETLARAIDRGLRRAQAESPWDTAYIEAQRLRLVRLLGEWMEVELARPEFMVAEQETKRKDVQVGPLRLSVRLDRVDVVDGMQVLIDYKTGEADTAEWMGDRPDRPQVPLYAVLASAAAQAAEGSGEVEQRPLGAVAFAEVRTGRDRRLRGVAERQGLLPRAGRQRDPAMDATSFGEQVERWREVLGRLATEFAEGDARVRPKRFPTSCERCGQRILCRVDAAMFEAQTEEDEAGLDSDRDAGGNSEVGEDG